MLGVRAETESGAEWRLWKIKIRVRSYVEHEPFAVRFKFRNLQVRQFPGGSALMEIRWTNGLMDLWPLAVPKLEGLKEGYATFRDNNSTTGHYSVRSAGYGVIAAYSTCTEDKERKPFQLTNWEGTGKIHYREGLHRSNPFHDIPATTWSAINTRNALIVSSTGLLIVALDKVVSLVMWLWRLFIQDP